MAAIDGANKAACLDIELYHRAVKRVTAPVLGFKSFWRTKRLIVRIETTHMIKKGQLHCPGGQAMSASDQFHSPTF